MLVVTHYAGSLGIIAPFMALALIDHSRTQPADPAQALLNRLDSEQIAAALLGLPEEYRVVSTLYFIEDFSYEQTAGILGIPVGTVRSRLHRARKILQKLLWRVAVERGLVPEAVKERA